MLLRVGDYVQVALQNETRRAIVATPVEDDHVDLVLLKEYGNSLIPETMDPYEYPPFSVSSVSLINNATLRPISSVESFEELRNVAAMFWRSKDWFGAISVYREIIHRLQCEEDHNHFFLLRADNAIRLCRVTGDTTYTDFGVVEPSADSQFDFSPAHLDATSTSLNHKSCYRISQRFHLHATMLLNYGRALVNVRSLDEAIDTLSYAIYISKVSHEDGSKALRSKCFFWRAKVRIEVGQFEAALRDARRASALADISTHPECESLVLSSKRFLDSKRSSMRSLTREFMKLIDNQIRDGSIDFNI